MARSLASRLRFGLLPLGIFASLAAPGAAQVTITEQDLPVVASRQDVTAVGMGGAYAADGRGFNAFLVNPALAPRAPFHAEAFDLGLTIGNESISAGSFLQDNEERFVDIERELQTALDAFNNQNDTEPMNRFLAFVRDFLDLYEDPVGGRFEPGFFIRQGPVTYGVYGQVQAELEEEFVYGSERTDLLREASRLSFPLNDADADRMSQLIVDFLSGQAELTSVAGLGVADLVGAVSYARPLRPGLTVGVTGKVVNRRVGLRIIQFENFDAPYQRSLKDIQQSDTRFGIDVGVLYELPGRPLSLGLAVQDLIASQANVNPNQDGITLDTAEDFQAELDRNGFTRFFVEDSSPIIATVGASYVFSQNLRVNADIYDLADQAYLERASDHLRLGAEYVAVPWLRVRGGLASSHPTGGASARLGALDLGYALAPDDLLSRYAHRLQFRIAF